MQDPLIDANEVSELLNVPLGWVREHTRNGHLPHVQLGRYVRYRRQSVIDYIDQQEAGGADFRKHRPVVAA